MERVAGIEPASSAWKAEVLPLNYTRLPLPQRFIKPEATIHRQFSLLPPIRASLLTAAQLRGYLSLMVQGGGFEPPKLSRQIYSLIPLAAREPLRKRLDIVHTTRRTVKQKRSMSTNLELARGVEPPTG